MQVSIITPCYNGERFVAEAIRSVQAQTYASWEMIIVDDCSEDESVAVVEAFILSDERIRLLSLATNGGPARARNRAIEEARGRYIAFLDCDDLWLPTKLEEQVSFMQRHGHPFVFCGYQIVSETGVVTSRVRPPRRLDYRALLKTCPIGCLTVVYDTGYFGKQYMPEIQKRQDFALWLKLLQITDFAYGLPRDLASYRVHKGSISSNKLSAAGFQWRVYRQVESLGLVRSIYYFCWYAILGAFKYLVRRL